MADFDAIVIGSGMSGGWAAKELTERGLKTLVIERGWKVEHGVSYNDTTAPWEIENRGRVSEEEIEEHYFIQRKCYAFNTANKHFWVKDSDHPYEFPEDKPFAWIRGYHLGGRSLLWARHSYRWSEMDFEANAATATARIGRSATPISRLGTITSSASPAFPARRLAFRRRRTACSCRRWN